MNTMEIHSNREQAGSLEFGLMNSYCISADINILPPINKVPGMPDRPPCVTGSGHAHQNFFEQISGESLLVKATSRQFACV